MCQLLIVNTAILNKPREPPSPSRQPNVYTCTDRGTYTASRQRGRQPPEPTLFIFRSLELCARACCFVCCLASFHHVIDDNGNRLRRRDTRHIIRNHGVTKEGPSQGAISHLRESDCAEAETDVLTKRRWATGHYPWRQRCRQDESDEAICTVPLNISGILGLGRLQEL